VAGAFVCLVHGAARNRPKPLVTASARLIRNLHGRRTQKIVVQPSTYSA
jgi:hypothetical protein